MRREITLRTTGWISMVAVLLAVSGAVPSAQAADADVAAELESLKNTVQVLTEEVRRIRDDQTLPSTDQELETYGGMGPSASKVYGATPGLSLGGYGEFHFAAPTDDDSATRTADYHRFITYVGYKFSEKIIMNTELEYEHATTSANAAGKSGSVSVEFSYLDFLLSDGANIRAGNLLVPVGFVNRMHEPPFYRGNSRPTVERQIIPSTWRELGAGLHGELATGVRYEAYLMNGLNAKKFSTTGVRGGRQKGNRALWEDVAVVVALDADVVPEVTVGGSIFSGGSDHGQMFDGAEIDALTTIGEAHLEVRHRGFRGRALVAASSIGDAAEISADLGATVPERQLGWYLEGSYDVAPFLGLPADQAFQLWSRYEDLELHREVAVDATANPALDQRSLAIGAEYSPHPKVVIKLDWTFQDNEADGVTEDPVQLGAGFVF